MFFIFCGLLIRFYNAFVDIADIFPLALSAFTFGITALACVSCFSAIYLHIHSVACVTVGLSLMLAWTIHPPLVPRSKLPRYLSSACFGLVSSIRVSICVFGLKLILVAVNAF